MYPKRPRTAFTLVEILIVMGIIVLVAGILIPVSLSLTERNQVPKGASLLENALQIGKTRAVAEKRPAGIRLVSAELSRRKLVSGNNIAFAWYDQIQYIEAPGDYTEAWVWGLVDPLKMSATDPDVPVRGVALPFWATPFPFPKLAPSGLTAAAISPGNTSAPGPGAFNNFAFQFNAYIDSNGTTNTVTAVRNQLLFGPISPANGTPWTDSSGVQRNGQRYRFSYDTNTQANAFLSTLPAILPGDRIELSGVGELFTVLAVSTGNIDISGGVPTANVRCPVIMLNRTLPRDIPPPLNGLSNYRVIRQPRAVPTLQPVKLPQDVVVDLTPSRLPLLGASSPPPDLDTQGNFYMSGVSAGINLPVTGITGLTNPPPPSSPSDAPPYVDILFSPSGEIIPTSQNFRDITAVGRVSSFTVGASDLITLWLHSVGAPDLWAARQATAAQGQADNQALVTVNARTGAIGSFPMNLTTTDPLYNVRINRGRISGNTGP